MVEPELHRICVFAALLNNQLCIWLQEIPGKLDHGLTLESNHAMSAEDFLTVHTSQISLHGAPAKHIAAASRHGYRSWAKKPSYLTAIQAWATLAHGMLEQATGPRATSPQSTQTRKQAGFGRQVVAIMVFHCAANYLFLDVATIKSLADSRHASCAYRGAYHWLAPAFSFSGAMRNPGCTACGRLAVQRMALLWAPAGAVPAVSYRT